MKTKHFKTDHEVVLAVDNYLVSAEAKRFAQLYHKGKRRQELREKQAKEFAEQHSEFIPKRP